LGASRSSTHRASAWTSKRWCFVARLLVGVTFCLVLCLAQNLLANKKSPVHPVNLNRASSTELQLVPGIGPSTADKILQMRKSHGAYKSVDESPRHQRHRAKTAGQNAQVPDRDKTPPTKAASTKPVTPHRSPHRSPLPPKRRRGKRKSHSASLDRAPVAHPFQGEGVPIGCGNHGMAALEGKPLA
jgi:hypothetical protein